MKILAIRIKNLASLEGITEIDFTKEPLSSAGIFAITGPTGSGKSTILDALCLALYSKTPRYIQAREMGIEVHDVQGSTISQGDARGILRDGTGDGYAEVDFVGIDNQNYRARWSVRRARNKAGGSIQADTIELTNLSSNIIIPGRKTETLKEIERLVGLNFEQFTRSVLLAQGDFTAFLKANKDEKSSLLEKLTGTHIYSQISKQIYENHKKEEQELRDLHLKSQGFTILSEEELTSLGEEKGRLESDIKSQTKEIEDLNKEITWHTRLVELQSEKEEAEIIANKAQDEKKNAEAREVKLVQIDRVQKTRNWIDAYQLAEQTIANKSLSLKQSEGTLLLYRQQGEELESILKLAGTNLELNITDQKNTIPLLDKAKELDILIKQKADQKSLIQKELEAAHQNYNTHLSDLKSKQQEAEQLLIDIQTLQTWKEENDSRKPIAINRDLIISKLSDAQKLVDSHLLISKERKECQEKLHEANGIKKELELESASLAKEKNAIQISYEILQKEISSIDIKSLEQKKAELSESIENTLIANAQWKLLFAAKIDFKTFSEKLSTNKTEYKTKELLLKQANEDLEKAQIQKDVSSDMVKKARLAAAENVQNLRSQLIPEEPCPVCGSESHPYTLHEPRLDKVMSEIEHEHQQVEHNHARLLGEQASLQEAVNNLQQTIQLQEAEILLKESALSDLDQYWSTLSLPKGHDKISDSQKAEWIDGILNNMRTSIISLQGEIQDYTHKKGNLDTQKSTLDELDKKTNEINNGIKDINRALVSHAETIRRILKEQEKTDQLLSEVEQGLSPHFSHEDWMNNWKKNPIPFLQRINSFAEQWKNKTEKLDQDTQNFNVLKATIAALEIQSKSLSGEIEKYEKEHADVEKSYAHLAQERALIFDGESTHVVEEKMRLAIETAQGIVNTHKKKQEELHSTNTRLLLQKEQLGNEIEELNKNLNGYTEQIQHWLSAYNKQHAVQLNYEELTTLLNYSHEWIDAERTALRVIEDTLTQALSVFNERKAQLKKHKEKRLSEQSFEELKALIDRAHSTLETITNTRNTIHFRLQTDKDNRKQIANLLKTIQSKTTIAENWSRLNEIIGSADGKKFRQIAQEYTLDVLLSYANVHLEMLTKRYRIQRIPNTLGLQVLDQDMGDEIRTVYSLSGGESFLVSLALALGLASLSSSKMKVESLFIDEGFGSLDPTTLNIAMDALERLHNKGRKVGVISHVQEMTERIPAQIKVSKQTNGKSRVEVLG